MPYNIGSLYYAVTVYSLGSTFFNKYNVLLFNNKLLGNNKNKM